MAKKSSPKKVKHDTTFTFGANLTKKSKGGGQKGGKASRTWWKKGGGS